LKNPVGSETKTQEGKDVDLARSDIASSLGKSDAAKKALIEERTKMIAQVFTEKDSGFRLTKKQKPAPSTGQGSGLYAGNFHSATNNLYH
jgi:hypothetical protein